LHISGNGVGGLGILLGFGKIKQLAGAEQSAIEPLDGQYVLFQQRTLPTQRLRALGIVPDIGVFQFTGDFFEAFLFDIEVKETPSATTTDRAGRRCAGESD